MGSLYAGCRTTTERSSQKVGRLRTKKKKTQEKKIKIQWIWQDDITWIYIFLKKAISLSERHGKRELEYNEYNLGERIQEGHLGGC